MPPVRFQSDPAQSPARSHPPANQAAESPYNKCSLAPETPPVQTEYPPESSPAPCAQSSPSHECIQQTHHPQAQSPPCNLPSYKPHTEQTSACGSSSTRRKGYGGTP